MQPVITNTTIAPTKVSPAPGGLLGLILLRCVRRLFLFHFFEHLGCIPALGAEVLAELQRILHLRLFCRQRAGIRGPPIQSGSAAYGSVGKCRRQQGGTVVPPMPTGNTAHGSVGEYTLRGEPKTAGGVQWLRYSGCGMLWNPYFLNPER